MIYRVNVSAPVGASKETRIHCCLELIRVQSILGLRTLAIEGITEERDARVPAQLEVHQSIREMIEKAHKEIVQGHRGGGKVRTLDPQHCLNGQLNAIRRSNPSALESSWSGTVNTKQQQKQLVLSSSVQKTTPVVAARHLFIVR